MKTSGTIRLTALLLVCVLLTGFSRNFLGVHTPQDVLVGLTEGIVMILIVRKRIWNTFFSVRRLHGILML